MPKQRATERLKFVLVLVICGAALAGAFQKSAGAGQGQPQRSFELVGMEVPLEKRVGQDDGAAFVVHFGGDTHGNLDTCG
ncbi:MAG TPA: hypothetical protein VLM38_09140 [Blastocatellia bacterium]|nr:hypothetical protein [Blastocatellia bacterium]